MQQQQLFQLKRLLIAKLLFNETTHNGLESQSELLSPEERSVRLGCKMDQTMTPQPG
jgi:hypothetical protein